MGKFPWGRCVRRGTDGPGKKVYLVSTAAAKLLAADRNHQLKIVSAGCKVFHNCSRAGALNNAGCPLRLSQESASLMLSLLLAAGSPRVVGLNLADMTALVGESDVVTQPEGERDAGER